MAGTILVRDVMNPSIRVVRPDTSMGEVVATLNKYRIGSVVVMQGERAVGIITERDILRRIVEECLAPQQLTAQQIMTSPVITINETATLEDAARLMAKKQIKKLPVANNGKLIGIVAYHDIVAKMPTLLSVLEEIVRPYRRFG